MHDFFIDFEIGIIILLKDEEKFLFYLGETMEFEKTIEDFEMLPEEAKKEVTDFIAFLKMRYLVPDKSDQARRTKLGEDPFVGLWKDRTDLADSTAWIRDIREREWHKSG